MRGEMLIGVNTFNIERGFKEGCSLEFGHELVEHEMDCINLAT
jgi:hypothetical protein